MRTGIPADRVFEILDAALQAIVDHYADVDLDGIAEPLPARQYISDGPTGSLCEELVVWPVQVFPGRPGLQELADVDCLVQRSVTIGAALIRCTPNHVTTNVGRGATPPDVSKVEAAARVRARDLVLVEQAWLFAHQDQLLGRPRMAFERAPIIPPQGGFGGVQVLARFSMQDAFPVGS